MFLSLLETFDLFRLLMSLIRSLLYGFWVIKQRFVSDRGFKLIFHFIIELLLVTFGRSDNQTGDVNSMSVFYLRRCFFALFNDVLNYRNKRYDYILLDLWSWIYLFSYFLNAFYKTLFLLFNHFLPFGDNFIVLARAIKQQRPSSAIQ